MPTPIWNKAKDDAAIEAEKLKQWALNGKVDEKADSFLDKLKASKWTGVILLVGAAIVIVFLISLF